MERVPVLVVDDNPINMTLITYVLVRNGYEVRTASNAAECFESLRAERPRLILMDLQLPGVDGFELTRQIKSDPATRSIPVVAVTASAMKGDEERARAAGCDGYLSKPIDTRALPGLIEGFLAMGR